MRFTVVHDHAHILQREPGHVASLDNLPHSLLNRWNELARNRAALYRVDKFESFPARQRLDAQIDFAKLAGAASLLLVAIVTLRLRHDRLTGRNRGGPGVGLDLVLRRH